MFANIIKLNLVLIILMGGLLVGCGSSGEALPSGSGSGVEDSVDDSTDDIDTDNLQKTGVLTGFNGYAVSGDVELFYDSDTDMYSLVLSNFNSEIGPDLKVYLSEGATPSNFLNLGDLTALSGTVRYDFPGSSFDPLFDHVIIWCEDFSVTFGRTAVLTSP